MSDILALLDNPILLPIIYLGWAAYIIAIAIRIQKIVTVKDDLVIAAEKAYQRRVLLEIEDVYLPYNVIPKAKMYVSALLWMKIEPESLYTPRQLDVIYGRDCYELNEKMYYARAKEVL